MTQPQNRPRLRYRAEIDGLRGFAAVLVIIFHAKLSLGGVTLFPGGYLAVDLFFVLSGYLIGRQIWAELKAGQFSVGLFFEKRIRRLVPALLFVIGSIILFAFIFLPPSARQLISENIHSVMLFFSNFVFAFEDPYFAAESLQRPFLHSWSLAVEEQFYFFIPFLLILFFKFSLRWIIICLAVIGGLSLGLAHWASSAAPQAGFYLLPFRFWELLSGVALALFWWRFNGSIRSTLILNALALFCLTLFLLCAIFFTAETRHPSLFTLIPVLCSVGLIFSLSGETWMAKIFKAQPLKFLGKISYTLYLWHFALFALWRMTHDGQLSISAFAGLFLLSLLLSIFSLYCIENPIRRRVRLGSKRLFDLGVMLLAGGALWLFTQSQLYMGRQDANVSAIIQAAKRTPPEMNGTRCRDRLAGDACQYIVSNSAREIILIGDSHAEALAVGLIPLAQERGYNLTLLLQGGCPLWPGIDRRDYSDTQNHNCHNKSQNFAEYIQQKPNTIIIYFAHMQAYLGAPNERNPLLVITNQTALNESLVSFSQNLSPAGQSVIVIEPTPWLPEDPVKHLQNLGGDVALSQDSLYTVLPSLTISEHRKNLSRSHAAIRSMTISPKIKTLPSENVFCSASDNICRSGDQGGLFYADDNHLSTYGASRLAQHILDEIDSKDDRPK